MQTRLVSLVALAAAAVLGCRTMSPVEEAAPPIALDRAQSTSVMGHWVLATPIDSTAFAGAEQVDLVLTPQDFRLTVAYRGRAPLTVSGALAMANGGIVTLTPGATSSDAAAVGFAAGQPLTRLATASGSTLVLAPPSATVPVPSSVWYRIGAARLAGIAR